MYIKDIKNKKGGKKMKKIISILVCLLLMASTIQAQVNTGVDANKQVRKSQEKALQYRKSRSISIGESERNASSNARNYAMEVDMISLIMAKIAKSDDRCNLIENPPLYSDIFQTESPALINLTKLKYIENLAKIGGEIDIVNPDAYIEIERIVQCIRYYASIIDKVSNTIKPKYKSYEELDRHVEKIIQKIKEQKIDKISVKNCRYAGDVKQIVCTGGILIEYALPLPNVTIGGKVVYHGAKAIVNNKHMRYSIIASNANEFAKVKDATDNAQKDLTIAIRASEEKSKSSSFGTKISPPSLQ